MKKRFLILELVKILGFRTIQISFLVLYFFNEQTNLSGRKLADNCIICEGRISSCKVRKYRA